MKTQPITEEAILARQTSKGGWTREQLADWGVPWPPPTGWKKTIIERGVPYSEVIEIFGGGNIIAKNKPLFCAHCDKDLIPEYERLWNAGAHAKELVAVLVERKGKIVERVWPNGRRNWGCSYCGKTC